MGLELPFDVLEEVLASTAMELERNQIKLANPGPKDDVEVIAVTINLTNLKHMF